MAGRGPAPKPAHLRQRTNRKAGSATIRMIEASEATASPAIPNPDGRVWHPLTLVAWAHAWASPMASQWLETDIDGLGRLAILWDALYQGDLKAMAEIRLQEQRFGFSPLDRSRLSWQISQADEAEQKTNRRVEVQRKRTGTHDPRHVLSAVK